MSRQHSSDDRMPCAVDVKRIGQFPMETGVPLSAGLLDKLRLTRVRDLDELESGDFYRRFHPYFVSPYVKHLTYRLAGAGPRHRDAVLPTHGAGGFGDCDIGYVADGHGTVLSFTETGLPGHCLTFVSRGAIECLNASSADPVSACNTVGLIYRMLPGTRLRTSDESERLVIWIPEQSLERRLAALSGEPAKQDLAFVPGINWDSGPGQRIRRLIWLLTEELASPYPFAANAVACRSFEDLLLYSLLQSLPHTYTDRLARATSSPVPRTVRRAEAYIRSRAGQPIALHEVADVAGCSVRALQLGFRRFRDITPAAAIRQARLEAVHRSLVRGEAEGTITEIAHQYGFTHPGRFTRLYNARFGASPAEALRRNSSLRTGQR